MNINLQGQVALTLDAQVVSVILDVLARNLSYVQGQQILDGIIIPQLRAQDVNSKPSPENKDGTTAPTPDITLNP